jgi:hypothetical protein
VPPTHDVQVRQLATQNFSQSASLVQGPRPPPELLDEELLDEELLDEDAAHAPAWQVSPAPHDVPSGSAGSVQAPVCGSQIPAAWQAPEALHGRVPQVPSAGAPCQAAHTSHGVSQAVSQQTPPTQNPVAHSAPVVQPPHCSAALVRPPARRTPPAGRSVAVCWMRPAIMGGTAVKADAPSNSSALATPK